MTLSQKRMQGLYADDTSGPRRRALMRSAAGAGARGEAELSRDRHEFRQRARPKLVHHGVAMRFDRSRRSPQLKGDLFVEPATDDKLEYFPFARGEFA